MTPPQDPLRADEIAALRVKYALDTDNPDQWDGCQHDVSRLLAALAATPPPERPDPTEEYRQGFEDARAQFMGAARGEPGLDVEQQERFKWKANERADRAEAIAGKLAGALSRVAYVTFGPDRGFDQPEGSRSPDGLTWVSAPRLRALLDEYNRLATPTTPEPDQEDESEEPWAEAAMWAYQFAGALSIAYDFEEGDIVPLLDMLSALAEGRIPPVEWPAVVPSLGVAGAFVDHESVLPAATPEPDQ